MKCNMVIQYMCGASTDPDTKRVRDGTTTDTIPDDPAQFDAKNGNEEFLYGMHESYDYYQECKTRDRNMGLFIADREEEGGLNDGRRSALFTRQNNNGDKHGFECPEERDYYPYWAATPWRDVAVLAEKQEYCDFYKSNSQNVKDRHHCVAADGTYAEYNNENQCSSNGGKWVTDKAWGISAPDCIVARYSRENHLGNGMGGYNNNYNWTLVTSDDEDCIKSDTCECVLRLRYNVSTGDTTDSPDGHFTDYTSNGQASPVLNDPTLKQEDKAFKLAIDTTQFGRTFQDRTYVFAIRPRPTGVTSDKRIYNINVRGKRGNIVQTYPATEYDFVPEDLTVLVNDYVHFQWTGCDTNPNGNAGEGTDGTDRSNIVQIENLSKSKPASKDWLDSNTPLFDTASLRKRFAYVGQDPSVCMTREQLLAANGNNAGDAEQDERNCGKLNAAPAYFDGGLVRMNHTSAFYYMSTRNNNFSNRGQKALLTVKAVLPTWAIAIVAIGGVLFAGSLGVAGAMFYAKSHPHSGIATTLNKF